MERKASLGYVLKIDGSNIFEILSVFVVWYLLTKGAKIHIYFLEVNFAYMRHFAYNDYE